MGIRDRELSERERIALGALLHDIGKVVQRASDNPSAKTHQEFGEKWIESHLPAPLGGELKFFARYHHFNPEKHPELDTGTLGRNDLILVAYADNVSAGEREIRSEDLTFNPGQPLRSIFSSINGATDSLYWPLVNLSAGINIPRRDLILRKSDYEDILRAFEARIKDIQITPDNLLALLEEFMTFVPSYTATPGDDISLYDHLKTTAAIALANYNYIVEKFGDFPRVNPQDIKNDLEKRYMLLLVDISGIQNFIYTVSSKGALRLLRARSFYIEMLLNFVAKKTLRSLELFDTNLIFLGGGNFTLLMQNTERAKKIVTDLIKGVNENLWERFKGKLYLNYAMIPLSGEDLKGGKGSKGLARIIDDLYEELNLKKFRKFSDLSMDKVFRVEEAKGKVCQVCGVDVEEGKAIRKDELVLCEFCDNLADAGRYIHRVKYVAYKPAVNVEAPAHINLYGDEKLLLCENHVDAEFLWIINPEREEAGNSSPIYVGNYPEENKLLESPADQREVEGRVLRYFGKEMLGVLRMDVDNLGKIFSEGVPEEKVSLSRLSSLSRFLNLYFKRYINIIAERSKISNKTLNLADRSKEPREVIVVYAGGDDLFVLGAWHDVVELAFDIRDWFREFVGGDHVTLSAGIAFGHLKMPVKVLAQEAGEAEEKAKSMEGKNSLTFFGFSYSWDEWMDVINSFLKPLIKDFFRIDEDGKRLVSTAGFPRAGIHKLMEISNLSQGKISLEPYTLLAHLIGRNRKYFGGKTYFESLLDIKNFKKLKMVKPALMWLDYLLR